MQAASRVAVGLAMLRLAMLFPVLRVAWGGEERVGGHWGDPP